MHDVHNNNVLTRILNLFQKKQVVATLTIREHRLQEIFVNSSDIEFSRFGAKLWNEIPCHIRQTLRKLICDILN